MTETQILDRDFFDRLTREAHAQDWKQNATPNSYTLPKPRNAAEVAALDMFKQLAEANTGEPVFVSHPIKPAPTRRKTRRKQHKAS